MKEKEKKPRVNNLQEYKDSKLTPAERDEIEGQTAKLKEKLLRKKNIRLTKLADIINSLAGQDFCDLFYQLGALTCTTNDDTWIDEYCAWLNKELKKGKQARSDTVSGYENSDALYSFAQYILSTHGGEVKSAE